MKFKLLVVIAVVGGMYYYGIKPADALEKGGELWSQFSSDFVALVTGKAVEDMSATLTNTDKVSADTSSSDPAGYVAARKAKAEEQAKVINNTVDKHVRELEEKINQETQ